MLFFVLLDGAVFVRVVALVCAGCVCVVGVAMREEKAGLLLPGGREGKIESYESVCVCCWVWLERRKKIPSVLTRLLVRSGVGVVSGVRSSGGECSGRSE